MSRINAQTSDPEREYFEEYAEQMKISLSEVMRRGAVLLTLIESEYRKSPNYDRSKTRYAYIEVDGERIGIPLIF